MCQYSNKQSPSVIYSGHLLFQTSMGPAKKFVITNVWDSRKFKILAFYKVFGKPNTVVTYLLTLVSLKGNRREKIYRYFYSNWYFIFG